MIFFLFQSQGVSLAGNGDSLVSDGCVNTTPHPRIRRIPAHVIFSAVAQDLSHQVNRNLFVSQNGHSSHLAQHVPRALIVVSFTLEHHLACHMRSSPTIHQTFIDVCITRRFNLRSIHRMCLSVTWLKRTRRQVVSPRISLKRTPPCWSNRFSSTDRV